MNDELTKESRKTPLIGVKKNLLSEICMSASRSK
jgi:hypothetical protein